MTHPPERLDGDGVVLRRPTAADSKLLAETLAANIEHLRGWMAWAPTAAVTEVEQVERLREVDARWDSGEEHRFLILSSDESTLVGVIGLHGSVGGRTLPGVREIGYWLAAEHVGHGYATAAAGALATAALALPDVHQVEIHCDNDNTRSSAVPARLGFRLDRVEDKPPVAPLETGRNQVWVLTQDARR